MLLPRPCIQSFVLFLLCALPSVASAQDVKQTAFPFALDGVYNEIETKYIFGFTTGSGIGIEGEKEFTTDTIGRFGKRGGRYSAPVRGSSG